MYELKGMLLKQDCFIVNTVNTVLGTCNLSEGIWNATVQLCFIYNFFITGIRISSFKQEDLF